MIDAIRVPPAGGWPCQRGAAKPISARARFRNGRRRILVGDTWYCLDCGRRLRWNWKHLTGGWLGSRWIIQWHHVGTWGTYGGC